MNAIIRGSLVISGLMLALSANAADRVTVKMGETIAANGYELSVSKTGTKTVNIKKGKKDKRGEYDKVTLDFSIKNVNAPGIDIYYTGNTDPRLEDAAPVAQVNVVNAMKALNMRPGLTTQSTIQPQHREFSYVYKETNEAGEEVEMTKTFRVGTHFLPGASRSISFNAWVKSGETPEISFEVYAK